MLFPLAVMILFVMFNASSSAQGLTGSGSATFCKAGQDCTVNNINGTASVTYFCPYGTPGLANGIACQILPSCVNNLAPAWCYPFPINLLPDKGGTFLWQGESVTASTAQAAAGQGYAFFGFNTNGSLVFVGFIAILIGVAILAGFSILGSGLNQESIQIMVQGALWLGAWIILSGLEGVGTAGDTFSQFNFFAGFGTALYAIMTVMYLSGFGGVISRAGV